MAYSICAKHFTPGNRRCCLHSTSIFNFCPLLQHHFWWIGVFNAVLHFICSGFIVIKSSSNKHCIATAVLINFCVPNVALIQGRCLFRGGAYSHIKIQYNYCKLHISVSFYKKHSQIGWWVKLWTRLPAFLSFSNSLTIWLYYL